MKTTLGELRGYIRQRLVEVKTHYPQLQPGTSWETGVGFYAPTDGTQDWRSTIPLMLRGTPHMTPAGAIIPAGSVVDVVDRIDYDRGEPPRHYPNYTSPARPDITNTPVIEWQGRRYAVFGASPQDFIKPDAGFQAGYTWNEAIVFVMAQQNRAMTPKEILGAAGELKGLGGQANSGLYIKNAIYKGLVKFDGKQGRSSFYSLTDQGRELATKLEEEAAEQNPPTPPTVIRRRREET